MRLLLIGTTGSPPFEHCHQEVKSFLGDVKRVAVLSAASLFDQDLYFEAVTEGLINSANPLAEQVIHVRWNSNWRDTFDGIEALIVPGGNTYALLQRLLQSRLLGFLRTLIRDGLPYVGSSAGVNVVGPNILTTNDWNVVGLTKFEGLDLVPFNVNPHYFEQAPLDAPNSEPRDLRNQRISSILAQSSGGTRRVSSPQSGGPEIFTRREGKG